MTRLFSLEDLVDRVQPGDLLALPVDYAGVSMAATPEIISRGIGGLRLVGVPTVGMQADMLIGAGLVASIETSAVTLGEAGGAPCFNRAVRDGTIDLRDSTCPAIHTGLLAAQKGVPFLPIRGLIDTDLLAHRADWKVIDNPLDPGDRIVVVPAIRPDKALFHAPYADRYGNVWIGRRRELAAMAYASKDTLVTVERVVDGDLMADETTAAGVLPALYVGAVAAVPDGARPYGCWGVYSADSDEIARYAAMIADGEDIEGYLATCDWAGTLTV